MSNSFVNLKLQDLDRLRLDLIAEQISWQDTFREFGEIREQLKTECPNVYRAYTPAAVSTRDALLKMIMMLENELEDTLPQVREKGHFVDIHLVADGWEGRIVKETGAVPVEIAKASTHEQVVRETLAKLKSLAS